MCGIVGILRLSGDSSPSSPFDEALLTRLRDTMTHRGPDAAGNWIAPDLSAALGHRRLSIIDLSNAASQPMTNEDGSIRLTFNGEIYNYASLRDELTGLGHRFHSHSDTETILHAYEQWGTRAIDKIDGMFAFGLWDSRERRLWLARDRMGKKPLYFSICGGCLVFASEIKAILAHPAAQRKICEEALWHYLTLAVAPAPLTLFEGIHKLPPATHLLIPQRGKWIFTEYWRPWGKTDSPAGSFDDYAGQIREELQTAVRRRLMSDVPFGVFLSGGVDSSANVALMSREMNRPVDTFSVGFEDQAQAPYNEIQYARKIAGLFKTNHREILISDRHFFDFADHLAWRQDEPLSDPVCFPLYYVSKLARDHGTIVIQVGEGSDEIFAGYEIYRNYLRRHTLYWRRFQQMPGWLREGVAGMARWALSSRQWTHLQRACAGEPAFVSAALAFYDQEKALLKPWPKELPWRTASLSLEAYEGKNPSFSMLKRLYPQAEIHPLPGRPDEQPEDFLKNMISWECHQRLGELLLMRLDKMTMACSVEGRAPFLDTRLVELAMRIPSRYKIVNGVGKAVLKRAVEPLIPHELIYRKKVGFCGGSGNMLTPAILDFAEKNIMTALPPRDWHRASLEGLLSSHRAGTAENSFQIWNLMNLSLWLKKWF
ncbi:MAG: asparagine synthase (glutamine-hydrolyzing) [Verrucomicrobiae bacterium]|nr:asparagine synthase (glutamine-hydrolyzing) [Verrucomicrobiae bacterium]